MTRLTFHLILHTHWDREWYLPRGGFLARLVPVVANVLDLLEREPRARFVLDGQTILAEDAMAVNRSFRDRLAGAVARGQLEVGPWYILADEVIPSGESLVRNLLAGSADAASLGGRMDVLYSPDAFGHPHVMPTLAQEFGIDAVVAWRGLGRPGGYERDLYLWRAADRSDAVLYHLPPAGYEIGGMLAGEDAAMHWPAIRGSLVARAATSHIAVFVGADHHAPTRDFAAMLAALQALEPDNEVRCSTLREFFAAVAPARAALAEIDGELRDSPGYTWSLQGVHATRARAKRRHDAVQLRLQRHAETLVALARPQASSDRTALLRTAWKTLLQCQFHDTIAGCCSDIVAREQLSRLATVDAIAEELIRGAIHDLGGHDPDLARANQGGAPLLLAWNPLARTRGGVQTAELTFFRHDTLVGPPSARIARQGRGFESFSLVDASGRIVPLQVLDVRMGTERRDAARHYPDQNVVDRVRIAFDVPAIGGLATEPLALRSGATSISSTGLDANPQRIANRFLEVHASASGRFNLIDRRSGEHYSDILQFVDEPDTGDTYSPSIDHDGKPSHCRPESPPRLIAHGPLLAAFEQLFSVRRAGCVTVSARMVLIVHADSSVLRVRIELENRGRDHRLRIRIPIGAGNAALAGAAFGFERRPVDTSPVDADPAEHRLRTAPAHHFVAAGDQARGLALVAPGFFEYEWTNDHALLLTILRSTGELSRESLPERPGNAGWPMATPEAQEPGRHVVEFALAPLADGDLGRPALFEQWWEEAFLPLQATFVREYAGAREPMATGFTLSGEGLIFSACKPAEHGPGIVLRCYNTVDAPVRGQWQSVEEIARATLVRADETAIGCLELDHRYAVQFVVPARGLTSIRVERVSD